MKSGTNYCDGAHFIKFFAVLIEENDSDEEEDEDESEEEVEKPSKPLINITYNTCTCL